MNSSSTVKWILNAVFTGPSFSLMNEKKTKFSFYSLSLQTSYHNQNQAFKIINHFKDWQQQKGQVVLLWAYKRHMLDSKKQPDAENCRMLPKKNMPSTITTHSSSIKNATYQATLVGDYIPAYPWIPVREGFFHHNQLSVHAQMKSFSQVPWGHLQFKKKLNYSFIF